MTSKSKFLKVVMVVGAAHGIKIFRAMKDRIA